MVGQSAMIIIVVFALLNSTLTSKLSVWFGFNAREIFSPIVAIFVQMALGVVVFVVANAVRKRLSKLFLPSVELQNDTST